MQIKSVQANISRGNMLDFCRIIVSYCIVGRLAVEGKKLFNLGRNTQLKYLQILKKSLLKSYVRFHYELLTAVP